MWRFILALFILTCNGALAQEWISELGSGFEMARAQDKKVLLFFSVADGCAVCQDLEQRVFKDQAFLDFASKRYVLVREDFSEGTPEAKIRHLAIVEKYNRDGFFPLVLVLDAAGRVLKKTGPYENEDAQAYIRMLQKP